MSGENFTEVSTQSWFSRLTGAFMGLLFGFAMFVAAFPLLFWNEGRALDRTLTLEEGSGAVIHISAESVKSENSGKLVHLSGTATTNETLFDPAFQISENALKLRRNVSMYQWEEESSSKTEKQLGGSEKTITEYRYNKVWNSSLINSADFNKSGYDNPGSMAYNAKELEAKRVTLGAFTLPASLASRIDNYSTLTMDPNQPVPEVLGPQARNYNNGYYLGGDPSTPAIGDLRINFEVVKPTTVSIVSQQQQSTFQPYATKAGGTIDLINTGNLDAKAMFSQAHTENSIMTWVLRFVGFMLMGIGLSMVLKPLSVIADVVPFVGDLVGAGLGFMAFVIAAILSLIVITIAWIFYRPLIGIALLVGVALLVWTAKNKFKKSKSAVALDKLQEA